MQAFEERLTGNISHAGRRTALVEWHRECARRSALLLLRLTTRQQEVLELMIAGHRSKEIAAQLGINEKTVKMHRGDLIHRLGASNSASAIRIGVEARFAQIETDMRRSDTMTCGENRANGIRLAYCGNT